MPQPAGARMHNSIRVQSILGKQEMRATALFLLLALSVSGRAFLIPASAADQPATTDAPVTAPVTAPATIIVVRHAEKADDPDDPALSTAGTKRARALARTLEHAGLDAAYASQYRRTRLTVAPTAQSAGLAVQIDPIEGDIPGWAQDFAAALAQDHAGETVLVAGHSNTVPPLVAALCRCAVEPLTEGDYDRLFIVHRAGGENPSLITARYGAE